jgi:hypothetical protein
VIHYEIRFPLNEIRKRVVIEKILEDIQRFYHDIPTKQSEVYYMVGNTLLPHSNHEVVDFLEVRCIRLLLCNSSWPYEQCLKDIRKKDKEVFPNWDRGSFVSSKRLA